MKRSVVLVALVCLSLCVHADESCEGGQCDEKDAPARSPTPGVKKNKYQKPGAKKNKYQKPGAKKNKYQRPGQKKNKYQRKNKYQKAGSAGNDGMGDYNFDDPTANHMQMGIKFDEQKKPDLSIKAFEAAVKFQGS